MTDQFEIGMAIESMASLVSLGIKKPMDEPVASSAEIELSDATTREMGWRVCAWHWDMMSSTAYNAVKSYIGNIYIRTRDENDAYKLYSCFAKHPIPVEWSVGNKNGRRVINYTIKFKKLIEIVEESS